MIRTKTGMNVKMKVLSDISNKENERGVGVDTNDSVIGNQEDLLMVLY